MDMQKYLHGHMFLIQQFDYGVEFNYNIEFRKIIVSQFVINKIIYKKLSTIDINKMYPT